MNIKRDELEALVERHDIAEQTREHIRQCVSFHGFAPPGLLIGVFMVDLALEKLGARPSEKLYAVAETPKCVPDAVQVMTHATIGNHRLRVVETGRFAITLNRPSREERTEGVRVYVNATAIEHFSTLNKWYTNHPDFKRVAEPHAVYRELLQAGHYMLSWESVRVLVPQETTWISVMCTECGERVPDSLVEGRICRPCAGTSYYERIDAP